jgi:hypothetical protein
MAVPRSGHTATLLVDGRLLLAGGSTDATHSAELFVPTSSRFVPTSGNMVYTRAGHCAVLLPNGRVLIVGGGDSKGTLFKAAEVFDPATGNFTASGDLNQVREGARRGPSRTANSWLRAVRIVQAHYSPAAELYRHRQYTRAANKK